MSFMLETYTQIGLFVSAFISSTIAPGGSEAVLAYMVSQQTDAIIKLVVIATIGNTLGAMTTWYLGCWAAKKWPTDQWLENTHRRGIYMIKKWGGWALLFSWLPIIGDALCFAGGWLKLSLLPAVVAIIVGKALRYLLIAYSVTEIVNN
jgi:membrane protein YqaA with SNARE-associated domain